MPTGSDLEENEETKDDKVTTCVINVINNFESYLTEDTDQSDLVRESCRRKLAIFAYENMKSFKKRFVFS